VVKHHQQQADAIDANVVVGAQRGNPACALLELEPEDIRAEARDQRQRNQEPGEGGQVGPHPHQALAFERNEEQDPPSGQRVNKTMLSKCWSISLPRYVIPQERQHPTTTKNA